MLEDEHPEESNAIIKLETTNMYTSCDPNITTVGISRWCKLGFIRRLL
jgi:hypothetical protein